MILAGLLLMIIAGLMIALGVMGGDGSAFLAIGGASMRLTAAELFLTGVFTAVVLMLGFWMIRAGISRRLSRRREKKELDARNRELETARQAEAKEAAEAAKAAIAKAEAAQAEAAQAKAALDSNQAVPPTQ